MGPHLRSPFYGAPFRIPELKKQPCLAGPHALGPDPRVLVGAPTMVLTFFQGSELWATIPKVVYSGVIMA